MRITFDTTATVRDLQAAGVGRGQAEALAAAVRKGSEEGNHVTRAELEAAVAKVEVRLLKWVLAVGAAVVAALKLLPGL
ncbi:MAG: hypothetical protein OXH76_03875 [Boseongicola sp.]|nr:hypothetical protein [Boseongicola sp.]